MRQNSTTNERFTWNAISRHRAGTYALCATWIVLHHITDAYKFNIGLISPALAPLQWVMQHGNLGVDVFMFCSAVSLYYSWSSRSDLSTYIRRRLLRILPATYLTFGTFWTIQLLSGHYTLPYFIYKLLLFGPLISGNDDGSWFIPAILLLYCLFPYLYTFIYSSKKPTEGGMVRRTLFLCLIVSLAYWLIHKYANGWFNVAEIALARVPVFISGVYVGHLVRRGAQISRNLMWVIGGGFCLWLVFAAGYLSNSSPWWWRLPYSLGAIPLLIILTWSMNQIPLRKKTGIVSAVSSCSLELYGVHLVLFCGLGVLPTIRGNVAAMIVAVLLSYTLAYGIHLLENRILTRLEADNQSAE